MQSITWQYAFSHLHLQILLTPSSVSHPGWAPWFWWFRDETRQKDTMLRQNTQTSKHLTRNATSKHKQTQPEDCLFYFHWPEKQLDKHCSLILTIFLFFSPPLFNFNLFFGYSKFTSPVWDGTVKRQVNLKRKTKNSNMDTLWWEGMWAAGAVGTRCLPLVCSGA